MPGCHLSLKGDAAPKIVIKPVLCPLNELEEDVHGALAPGFYQPWLCILGAFGVVVAAEKSKLPPAPFYLPILQFSPGILPWVIFTCGKGGC